MVLVIMAAGMGSRFGGLKQVEPMDDDGNFIIDYSIFDAIKCGFNKIVFIIKEENYELFRDTVGKRIEDKIKVEYIFQKLDNLPQGFSVPEGREKPWGTAHAILCCKEVVKEDFAIINADDFYGFDAFKVASAFIKKNNSLCGIVKKWFSKKEDFLLVAYKCKNTITDNGSAKRGVCTIENNKLLCLEESLIEKEGENIFATPLETTNKHEILPDTPVSMNLWCFTPKLFDYLEKRFPEFLNENIGKNPLKCEYLIPTVVDEMSKLGLINVHAKNTTAKWFGVTYKEDKPQVVEALKGMREDGTYPISLWKK